MVGAALAVGLIALIGGGWGYHAWRAYPAHWRAKTRFLQQAGPERLRQMAGTVQSRLAQHITGADQPVQSPAELLKRQQTAGAVTKTVRLDLDRINAWLATRFRRWMSNQQRGLPGSVGRMMLSTREGKLVLSFAYYFGGRAAQPENRETTPRIVSLTFDATVQPDGRATMGLDAVRVGTLPLPEGWVVDEVIRRLKGGMQPDELAVAEGLLRGKAFTPRWRLDRRVLQLTDVTIDERHIGLTFRHAPVESEAPKSATAP